MTSTTSRPRTVPAGELQICGTCLQIRGPVPGRSDGATQLCDCTPVEVRRQVPLWGGDENLYAELCRCCGLVLLRVRSKWSVWFCADCKPLVVAFNGSVGRAAVPIGRHTLMAGVGLDPAAKDPAVIERVAGRMFGLFDAMGVLRAYTATAVARNLAAFGFEEGSDVALDAYLRHAVRSRTTADEAFAALLEGMLGLGPEPA